jgi:hypothetical protein
MIIINADIETIQKAIDAKTVLRNLTPNFKHLTEDQIGNVVEYAERIYRNYYKGDFDLLKYEHYSGACGCMGKEIESDVGCHCKMSYFLDEYKYDVALRLKMCDCFKSET